MIKIILNFRIPRIDWNKSCNELTDIQAVLICATGAFAGLIIYPLIF